MQDYLVYVEKKILIYVSQNNFKELQNFINTYKPPIDYSQLIVSSDNYYKPMPLLSYLATIKEFDVIETIISTINDSALEKILMQKIYTNNKDSFILFDKLISTDRLSLIQRLFQILPSLTAYELSFTLPKLKILARVIETYNPSQENKLGIDLNMRRSNRLSQNTTASNFVYHKAYKLLNDILEKTSQEKPIDLNAFHDIGTNNYKETIAYMLAKDGEFELLIQLLEKWPIIHDEANKDKPSDQNIKDLIQLLVDKNQFYIIFIIAKLENLFEIFTKKNLSIFVNLGKFILNRNDNNYLKIKLTNFIKFLSSSKEGRAYLLKIISQLKNISGPEYDSIKFNIYTIYLTKIVSQLSDYLTSKIIPSVEMKEKINTWIHLIVDLFSQYKTNSNFYLESRLYFCEFLKDIILPSISINKISSTFILKNLMTYFGETNHPFRESNNEITFIIDYISHFSAQAGIEINANALLEKYSSCTNHNNTRVPLYSTASSHPPQNYLNTPSSFYRISIDNITDIENANTDETKTNNSNLKIGY